ncbi:unnamed protein product [Somion occarium]|uniref:BRCT domain-containing protein n=1 Tax=Somion occarium TaxID=3059160 RepID=A0ABP1DTV1_9APHY
MTKSEVFRNSKRTRSQLTLPDFSFDLGRSPLKDARVALRHNVVSASVTEDVIPMADGEDGRRLSLSRTPPKRPGSPLKDTVAQCERELKRMKWDSPQDRSVDSSQVLERHSVDPSLRPSTSRKPASMSSIASPKAGSNSTPTSVRRAQSVPPQSSTPKPLIPYIDLRRMSPSPWRSPAKKKLRIASVPPMDSIPDSTEATGGPSPIHDLRLMTKPSSTEHPVEVAIAVEMDADMSLSNETTLTGTPVLEDKILSKSPKSLRIDAPQRKPASTNEDDPMGSSPLSSPPSSSTPPEHDTDPKCAMQIIPPPSTDTPARPPPPALPRSPTESITRSQPSLLQQGSSNSERIVESLRNSVETLTAGIRSESRPKISTSSIASSSSSSRLPRPSAAPPPAPLPVASSSKAKFESPQDGNPTPEEAKASSRSEPSKAQPKKQSRIRAMKPKAVATGTTSIPLGGRMTRSASLRQQENKKKEETATPIADTSKTPVRPASRANLSRPTSRAGPSSAGDMLVPLKDEPPASANTPGRTLGRKRSKSFAYAQPTSSSAAKSNPNSPVKPRNVTGTLAGARLPTLNRDRFSVPPPASSLSNLSMALEKLNAPPPSRPNTSMGFNRAMSAAPGMMNDGDECSEDGLRGKRRSTIGNAKGKAKDDSHLSSSTSTTNSSSWSSLSGKPASSIAALGSNPRQKTPAPLGRSATVGSFGAPGTASAAPQRHSELMLPPPVPKAASSKPPSEVGQSAKRINLSSGIIAGRPKGKIAFGSSSRQSHASSSVAGSSTSAGTGPSSSAGTGVMPKPRIFGVGSFASGLGKRIGNRVVHRASKPSPLPMVEGSPVKGGSRAIDAMDEDAEEQEQGRSVGMFDFGEPEGSRMEVDEAVSLEDLRANGTRTPTNDLETSDSMPFPDGSESEKVDKEKGKEKAPSSWRHNASRRASLASQLLSQSLSSLPQTPPRSAASGGKGKGRAAGSFPPSSSQVAGMKTAPGVLGRTSDVGAHVSAHGKAGVGAAVEGTSGGLAAPNGATVGSLKVLRDCTIFVDVRTDDGDDAGGLFVDMLRGMGAKILSRVGQTCTHIVYKNGLMSTITKYRLHQDPKPHVVGIAWVVECVEKRARVDETKFLVNLDLVNVAGTNKRRRSMLPKHLFNSPVAPSTVSPAFSNHAEGNSRTEDRSSSPLTGSDDNSPRANTSLDDLPPLERARRRKSTLLNHGITRT